MGKTLTFLSGGTRSSLLLRSPLPSLSSSIHGGHLSFLVFFAVFIGVSWKRRPRGRGEKAAAGARSERDEAQRQLRAAVPDDRDPDAEPAIAGPEIPDPRPLPRHLRPPPGARLPRPPHGLHQGRPPSRGLPRSLRPPRLPPPPPLPRPELMSLSFQSFLSPPLSFAEILLAAIGSRKLFDC
ncbi:translation initiation factor IF-2-like [Phoenix dactylifera]|uniref:Translation initiation factor IF-2-like n=1 Tax=Phoenix dactylifera TaxID=42345 RepID=A0A8B8ZHE2_PHODC|nr:translation initiation factor IF-2-like [Phoenix dactylifera]